MLREGQELYVLIEWPDGQVRRIPLAWTDQVVVEPTTMGARFTPVQLLTLRRWLDDHLEAGLDKEAVIVSPEEKVAFSGGDDNETEDVLCPPPTHLASPIPPSTATSAGTAGSVDTAQLGGATGDEGASRHHERRSR